MISGVPIRKQSFMIFIIWMLSCVFINAPASAGIFLSASPTEHTLAHGDQITLEVQTKPGAKIEWYVDGELSSRGAGYKFTTAKRTIGSYQITAIASLSESFQILNFQVNVNSAPLLYRPKSIVPSQIESHNGDVVSRDKLWVASLRGRLTRASSVKKVSNKEERLPDFFVLNEPISIRIGSGSDAVFSLPSGKESILARGPAKIDYMGGSLVVRYGRIIWRRFEPMPGGSESKVPQSYKILLGPEARLSSSGPGDVFINVEELRADDRDEENTAQNLYFLPIGGDFQLDCKSESLILKQGSAAVISANGKLAACKKIDKKINVDDIFLTWVRDFMPHWFDDESSSLEIFLRSDLNQINLQDQKTPIQKRLANFQSSEQWTKILDTMSLFEQIALDDPKYLLYRANAYLNLGFYRESKADFQKILDNSPDNAQAAKGLGDVYAAKGEPKTALTWYQLAENLKYPDKTLLYKKMSHFATESGQDRLASKYQLSLVWSANDEETQREEFAEFMRLYREREFSGQVRSKLGVVSHVLPINSVETVEEATQSAVSNRSLATENVLTWAYVINRDQYSEIIVNGTHELSVPFSANTALNSLNDHLVEGDFGFYVDAFKVGVELGFGTKIREGERQVDEYRSALKVLKAGDVSIEAKIFSVKALDPNPGGGDLLDSKIKVFQGAVDHSRIDLGLAVSAFSVNHQREWDVEAAFSSIDFRSSDLAGYDASEFASKGSYERLFWRRFYGGPAFDFKMFNFKGGSDQTSEVSGRLGWMPWALWKVGVYSGFLSRVSSDPLYSYVGHSYGVEVNVNF